MFRNVVSENVNNLSMAAVGEANYVMILHISGIFQARERQMHAVLSISLIRINV